MSQGDRLVLYACKNCCTVSTRNFRDSEHGCPVCHVVMEVSKIKAESDTLFVEMSDAPHVDEDADVDNEGRQK